MKKMLLTAAFAGLLMIGANAQQKSVETQPYENYIQLTGKAEKEVVPDEIYMRIVLDENGPTKKGPIDAQEKEMTRKLRSIGVDTDKKLTVTGLKGGYKSYVLKKTQGSAVKTYELKVGDAAAMANVYKALDEINISDVKVLRTYYSKMKELEKELKLQAVVDAKENASVLAGAVGQKAGRAIMISEWGNIGIQGAEVAEDMVMLRNAKMSVAGVDNIVPDDNQIEFRKLKLTYTVQVKFELE